MMLESQKQNIPYSIKISRRAKRMRIAVYCDSSVVVTLPLGLDFARVESFVKEKFNWIANTLEKFSARGGSAFGGKHLVKSGKRDYRQNRQQALSLAKAKVEQWNSIYQFPYNRVNIKNQKTRWGSCSKQGNLNFNYKIVFLRPELADYIIVHELCHIKEFNHSKNFWQLVGQTIPDYNKFKAELRTM